MSDRLWVDAKVSAGVGLLEPNSATHAQYRTMLDYHWTDCNDQRGRIVCEVALGAQSRVDWRFKKRKLGRDVTPKLWG